jgi:phage repressor protein C with HTH and peptisase S24 domain
MRQRYVYLINSASPVNFVFMTNENSGDRLRKLLDEKQLTPTEAARDMGVTTQNLNNWFNRGIPARQILNTARVLKVRPEWLSTGLGERNADPVTIDSNASYIGPMALWDDETPLDDDEVDVPFLKEVELSAGQGRTVVEQSNTRKLRFGKLTLRKQNVQPSEAVCVMVSGNSMEPVLPDGSTVGVDQGATSVIDGKMYALNHGGQLRVKMLYRLPGGGIRMRSYNREEHPDEEYSAQEMIDREILVLGRVFWSSVLW